MIDLGTKNILFYILELIWILDPRIQDNHFSIFQASDIFDILRSGIISKFVASAEVCALMSALLVFDLIAK